MQPTENTPKEKANNNASRNLSDGIQSIKEDGASIAETMIEQGQDTYDHIKSSSARYIKMLEKEVAAKPVQSMAIAVGAGRRSLAVVTACCLILSLSACGNTKGERALSGAGIGAGVGAAGSAVTGGSVLGGAAVGGVVGAAAGALTDKDQIDLDK